jgi:PIN domain nuclease of toxin-antitoxin system
VVVWLYDSGAAALPDAARRLLEEEPLTVSPMVEFELGLLHEIGRIVPTPPTILTSLHRALGVEIASTPFAQVVGAASELTWTRDPSTG